MDIKELQSFISTLPMDKDMVKTVGSVKKSVESIYAIEEREFKREKKEYAEEQKEARKKARDAKRKKADKQPGMLKQILGDKNEQKRAGMDLQTMLMTGGVLAGIGGAALAWNFKDEIGDYVNNTLKPLLMEKIDEGITVLQEALQEWTNGMLKQGKELFSELIAEPAGQFVFDNFQEPLQDMFGGYGITSAGTVYTLTDITTYRDGIIRTAGGIPESLVEPFNETTRRLRIDQSLEDQIERRQDELKMVRRVGGPGSPSRIEKLESTIKNLYQNRRQNRVFMNQSFSQLGLTDADLQRVQRQQGRRDDQGYIHRQTGGTVDTDKRKGDETDERLFSTTAYMEGAKRPTDQQRLQTGGLVLFQGHGDVPPGSGIAPGTDGPGTDIQGKFKPTAEQHFVSEVARRTVLLAQRENVPISYQAPTGHYHSASHPKSNWSLANGIRRNGGSAIELHFDAWGMQDGKYMEGKRGILKGGQGALSAIEKSIEKKFGVHPSSSQGWGTLMLELDSLKYARTRIDSYTRMLVDSVKSAGASGSAPTIQPSTGGTSNITPQPQTQPQQQSTNQGFDPLGGLMSGIQSLIGGFGAFGQGFKEGFESTFRNPFANAEKHQNGGRVGGKGSSLTKRFNEVQSTHNVGAGDTTVRPVVVVKRRAQVSVPSDSGGSAPVPSGSGLNMLELKQAIHRQVNAAGI